ncbi:MAG: hypothetical protein HDR00_15370 [Lachnospiraceae bacterium]|nr:hypothetical protein [Lachnospiraceae bacterium]
MFDDIFKWKKCNKEKLSAYGFIRKDGQDVYETNIMDGAFRLCVSVAENGDVDTDVIEIENGEPYILYKTVASGAFVGEIRAAVEEVLTDIADACYDPSVFKTNQSQMVIEYVRKKYGDELEFLWKKSPDNAIWRRKDNQKWYGAILTVNGRKIGLDSDKMVEIIDLRMKPENRNDILSREHYYPGWHMNKKSWYTLVFDNGIDDEEIKLRITESYELAKK